MPSPHLVSSLSWIALAAQDGAESAAATLLPPWQAGVALLGVWSFEIWLWVSARRERQGIDAAAALKHEARCRHDLRLRAQRGLPPDWNRYAVEAERLFEPHGDRLRSLASAALAVGLFGTLLFLVITIATFTLKGTAIKGPHLIANTLESLLGSLGGVFVHLCIVLFFLRSAEERFFAWLEECNARLQQDSDEHPLQVPSMAPLREELSQLGASLSGELAKALAKAATGFPAVVRHLNANVERLSKVLKAQSASLKGAQQASAASAAAVATVGKALLPAAERLAESAAKIESLPGALRAALDDSRDPWLAGLRSAQEESLRAVAAAAGRAAKIAEDREDQMLKEVHSLEAAVGELRDAIGGIAAVIGSEIAAASGVLGTAFGREARDATRELAERIDLSYGRLLGQIEGHQQQWVNRIGTIVDELFARVGQSLDERLLRGLEGVANVLQGSAAALSSLAPHLDQAVRDWNALQGEAAGGWRDAGRQAREAATSLSAIGEQLSTAALSLTTGADGLGKLHPICDALERLMHEVQEARQHLMREEQEAQRQRDGLLDALAEELSRTIQLLVPAESLPAAAEEATHAAS